MKPKPENSQSVGPITVLLVLAAGAGFVYWFGFRSSTGSGGETGATAQENDNTTMAWVMAQEFVKKELKSPGSADFGSLLREYQDPKRQVREVSNGRFVVTGWVDAQNSHGAKVRNRFSVTLQFDGRETWTAVEGPRLKPW